jgi:tetratricopeptide (TPR) repeat protein
MQRRFILRATLCRLAVPLAVALCCGTASADDLSDVNTLFQSKQDAEALSRADAYLKHSPRDARMRFLKGLVLADMGRRNDAIAVFDALTADFPTMPEPYNNLAVLHAAEGRYDDARAALEKAINANPNYTKAYENLGDIYATLATQRYGKMLQQDPDNVQVRLKYLMVRSALDNAAESFPKAAPKPVITSAELPAIAAKAVVAPTVAKPAAALPANAVNAASTPAGAVATGSENDHVLAQVNEWAKAWSGKDISRYLSFYGPGFKAPKGESRQAWETQRRARIVKRESIRVSVESPVVTMKDGTATVYFLQRYVSGKVDTKDRKILVMQKSDGQWKIVEERVAG